MRAFEGLINIKDGVFILWNSQYIQMFEIVSMERFVSGNVPILEL